MSQRQAGREAYLAQSPQWQHFTHCSQEQLQHLFNNPCASDTCVIDQMHHQILTAYCDHFPSVQVTRPSPEWRLALPTISTMWDHRRCLQSICKYTLLHVLRAWYHACRFAVLKRFHKKQAKQLRQAKFAEVVTAAAAAAERHDTHKLFHVINRHAPKQPRRQIQLRTTSGHMATPPECAAILNKFVADTWSGPPSNSLQFPHSPGVPFTVTQLAKALASIPATKATAKHCGPGVIWRQHAQVLAPLLYSKLEEWWSLNSPYIPQCWRNGWVFMIPKPSKPPVVPQNLRPLALQEPVGKSIIGILIQMAVHEAMDHLVIFPIWAYLTNRSTLDAIRRVCDHCAEVRQLLSSQRSTPHLRATRAPRPGLFGGIQMCIDLQRAFDMVNRRKLFQRLQTLQISSALIQLLSAWHENAEYVVQHDSMDCPIAIGRGVRQGCKAAPGLWNFFLVLFLHDLMSRIPLQWIQDHLTIYADDIHVGAVFYCLADLCMIQKIFGVLMFTLQSMDMCINQSKSVIILAMHGHQSRHMRRRFVSADSTGERFKIVMPDQSIQSIPIQSSAKYLGIIISYGRFEDDSLHHRLTLMKVGFHRLQKWLTGKHCLTTRQRFTLWRTCIYPILSYGIFATGVTPQGLQLALTQMTIMIRKILHDHSFLTGRTNADAHFASVAAFAWHSHRPFEDHRNTKQFATGS